MTDSRRIPNDDFARLLDEIGKLPREQGTQSISFDAAHALFADRMTIDGVTPTPAWRRHADELCDRHALCCGFTNRDAFLADMDANWSRWLHASRAGAGNRRSA